MKIDQAAHEYEEWLGKQLRILPDDLKLKHQRMAEDFFAFLRATFFRWMQLWPEVCPEASKTPAVLAVGDLHVENFGTWRDVEGRLVWGINDLDEAYPMPYAVDLVRLQASAHLAVEAGHLKVGPEGACCAIMDGYAAGLEAGGRPMVLAEEHKFLRETAMGELRDPVQFWQKMDALATVKDAIPAEARQALEQLLPEPKLDYRLAHRVAGLGSLGRERYVAIAEWRGAKIAREAKALAPSACVWANNGKGSDQILYQKLLDTAVRCIDPFVHLKGRWIVRRLAPDCSRIELADVPDERDETRLLKAMGFETANLHLGSKDAIKNVRLDFKKRSADWLRSNAKAML
ncbi:MAG: DUF2252 family protein, partial [Terriglobia bacterium]